MDHQAFAQLLGNYGEFIGSLGIVVSLVYLAIQIRSNTRVQANPMLRDWWATDTNPTNYSQEFVDAINSANGIDVTKAARPPGTLE